MRATATDPRVDASVQILTALLSGYSGARFDVRFWDGSAWQVGHGSEAKFSLSLSRPSALRRMFQRPGMRQLGEAFVAGEFDVSGDMISAFALGDYLLKVDRGVLSKLGLLARLRSLPRPARTPEVAQVASNLASPRGSRARLKEAIKYHYDVDDSFWSHWLDRRRLYSCAYFSSPGQDLETAQVNKIDYVCRKLSLTRGDRFLDMGCGWGALMMHAAAEYGVDAVGVTLSARQAAYVRQEIKSRGLDGSCRVVEADFREITTWGDFDKIACVGAIEHVPEKQMADYFGHAFRLLRPGGLFLSHGITCSLTDRLPAKDSFVDAYVFPDHSVMPLTRSLPAAEEAGFEIRDVESLREHYALTCRHWLRRLEANRAGVEASSSGVQFRVYRLYLAAMAHYFDIGINSLHQVLLHRTNHSPSGLPLTRANWYSAGPGATTVPLGVPQ